ncbi:hypothetical protein [Methylomarinum vadi]|uniref:hypothetical protein n=1 Tax=Methylomarinum vadi TaxID=438855 RepID=UPI000A025990|nr:hypothetical protein [Methylomarinum vadi]
MAQQLATSNNAVNKGNDTTALLLGTGLAVASMILVPAVATRLGLGASITGALRIALMRASSRATYGKSDDSGASSAGFSCH